MTTSIDYSAIDHSAINYSDIDHSVVDYPIYDYLPTMSSWQQNSAIEITFSLSDTSCSDRDYEYHFADSASSLSTSNFAFFGFEGASYDIFSTSYYDPFELRLYDDYGHVIAINDDLIDGEDSIEQFEAPYTGWYYVDASWQFDYRDDYVSLSIHETLNDDGGDSAGDDFDFWGDRQADKDDVLTIARLYNAAFDRLPDNGGLNYWIDEWESGMNLDTISSHFYFSNEFVQTYGQLSDVEYIDVLYLNVLDRPPENAGLDYWTGQLEQGMDRAEVLARFSDSIENIVNTQPLLDDIYYAGYGEWLL
ncbi:MAG: hypothetical protein CSA52_03135 [Gammaproteobacteria bacterium]|nr:MAG: hypothetical protein CSB48_03865 [Pseudomonadota bacterium]PIE38191.1 MAG: hypothetical protein CSA52_03135 [Gammaproteobacteria bacterium]